MKNLVDEAVAAIDAGGIVVVPTDRWYMLCCDGSNVGACESIFAAKGRSMSKSLVLELPANLPLKQMFLSTPSAEALTAALWPGDLALRLRWGSESLGRRYAAVGNPIALVSQHRGMLNEIGSRTRSMVAATSANFSGDGSRADRGPSITLDEVREFVSASGLEVSTWLDGGVSPYFQHMTIVDCAGAEPVVEREGLIHQRVIRAVLGSRLQADEVSSTAL